MWLVTVVLAVVPLPVGKAAADPAPRPAARRPAAPAPHQAASQAAHHGAVQAPHQTTARDRDANHAEHARGVRPGRHRHRPRSVVRCQNDETDQIDEFDTDDAEPRHVVLPGRSDPYGQCPDYRDALALAGLLHSDHGDHGDRGQAATSPR